MSDTSADITYGQSSSSSSPTPATETITDFLLRTVQAFRVSYDHKNPVVGLSLRIELLETLREQVTSLADATDGERQALVIQLQNLKVI